MTTFKRQNSRFLGCFPRDYQTDKVTLFRGLVPITDRDKMTICGGAIGPTIQPLHIRIPLAK